MLKNIKIILLLVLVFSARTNIQAANGTCGLVFNDTFDQAGALPGEWTEYNTSGRVMVENGYMKFDHNTTKPSAFRTFTPVTTNFSFALDVQTSRNSVNGQIHLVSSTGKYLGSLVVGKNSTATIKYATTITGGVPEGYIDGSPKVSLLTNTVYSLSAYVDFVNQNVDYYCNGNLMAGDVPFLEPATDFAKVDIQILYMYSNTGTFFFDNISVVKADEQRLLLTNEVTTAQKTYSEANVGDGFQQYPQAAATAFKQVLDAVGLVIADCTASSEVMTTTLADLQAAEALFLTTKNNPVALTLYSAGDFTGEAHDMYCGYYNGTLGTYSDWAVSFKLKKGYMATFAQNINGTGVSKVYVASKEDLAINLPAELQKTASFLRVGPWRDVHKKGIGAKGDDVVAALNNAWYYNWGTTGETTDDLEFVPNQWSGGTVDKAISLGQTMSLMHYMAFNEPDNTDQSNMTTDKAIEKYEAMLASGLRLGSPACTDGAKGAAWRDEFMTKAEANGLRVDYMVVHYYKKSTAASFYNWLKDIYDQWHRPIWIKEFNYGATWVSNAPATNQEASDGLESYLNKLDGADFVERYAVFTWQPDNPVYSLMSVRNPITLSISGNMYHNHISPIAYKQEVYAKGPNGINDNPISPKVSVYPTVVADGVLHIDFSDDVLTSKVSVNIYNVNGQIMKQEMGSDGKIDVSTLACGVYMVHMICANDSYVKKIVVK